MRAVTEASLRVDPSLLGRPLASPWRRAAALAFDGLLLILPTIVVAVGASALSLRIRHPEAFEVLRSLLARESPAAEAYGPLAELLVEMDAPGLPAETRAAVERGDLPAAGRSLDDADFLVVLNFADGEQERLRESQILVELQKLIPRVIRGAAMLCVPALYFTLLTSGRRRGTLGKRLFGIEVVHLHGKPLTLYQAFERFGGYFALFGTFGIGLLNIWREPNRRLPQDRDAGTVVLRKVRRKK
jgi:hypothetical protein